MGTKYRLDGTYSCYALNNRKKTFLAPVSLYGINIIHVMCSVIGSIATVKGVYANGAGAMDINCPTTKPELL